MTKSNPLVKAATDAMLAPWRERMKISAQDVVEVETLTTKFRALLDSSASASDRTKANVLIAYVKAMGEFLAEQKGSSGGAIIEGADMIREGVLGYGFIRHRDVLYGREEAN